MRNETLTVTWTYTPSYVPLHHCIRIMKLHQTQGNDPNTDDDEELLCLHSQPPLASCEMVSTLTLQSLWLKTLSWPVIGHLFFWETAPCPVSHCIVEQKLKRPWILLFWLRQFKLPSAWWENRVCVCVCMESNRWQCKTGNDGISSKWPRSPRELHLVTMRVWTLISPLWHWFFCLFSLRLFLCIYSDSFSASMSIMSFLLHFKGMWIMTFMENTQILSHTFEVWNWHGLFLTFFVLTLLSSICFSAHYWTNGRFLKRSVLRFNFLRSKRELHFLLSPAFI